jgi:hypothetical protein
LSASQEAIKSLANGCVKVIAVESASFPKGKELVDSIFQLFVVQLDVGGAAHMVAPFAPIVDLDSARHEKLF